MLNYLSKLGLTIEEQMVLRSEMERTQKGMFLAYAFWFVLGTVGLHRFYVGRKKSGIIMSILDVTAIISLITLCVLFVTHAAAGKEIKTMEHIEALKIIQKFLIWAILAGVLMFVNLIWWIIDAFLLYGMVQGYNERVETKIIQQIKQVRSEVQEV